MAKPKGDELNQTLSAYFNTINDTLQLLDRSPSHTKVEFNWNNVLQISDHLSKQATIVGMLWTCAGEPPKAETLKETMESYFNTLQGFLLHCHGSMVSSGPTLYSSRRATLKQIVGSIFKLLQASVSLYEGSYEKERKPSIPQLTGAVWEACSNLKKVPTTNIKAIGNAMTQVVVSVKDVLREMKELKPTSSSSPDHDDDSAYHEDDDLDDDLSPEELEVADMVTDIVSETLTVIKELIRDVSRTIKLENPTDNGEFVDSLEKLLALCQGTGVQIDELGACVYPPQDPSLMKQTAKKIAENINEIEAIAKSFKNPFSSETFFGTCRKLHSSIEHMVTELDTRSETE